MDKNPKFFDNIIVDAVDVLSEPELFCVILSLCETVFRNPNVEGHCFQPTGSINQPISLLNTGLRPLGHRLCLVCIRPVPAHAMRTAWRTFLLAQFQMSNRLEENGS